MHRLSIENPAGGTVIIRDRHIVYASAGAAALVGRTVAELVGRHMGEVLAPEERQRLLERHERRLAGEPVPSEFECFLVLPDGSRRIAECQVTLDGGDLVMDVRDVTAQAALRARLSQLAQLGATIQREHDEEAIFARVRTGLAEAGLASALLAAQPEGVRFVWAELPSPFAAVLETRLGRPLAGWLGPWTPLSRRAWETGAAFADDWVQHVAAFVPAPFAGEVRDAAAAARLSRAALVRLDERAAPRFYLVLAGDWIREGDVAALRLFGAQVAAALDAARAIAGLARQTVELAALNWLGEKVGEASDLHDLFRQASMVVSHTVGCDAVAIFVVDEGTGELVRTFDDSGSAQDGRPTRISLASDLGSVARTRTAAVVRTDEPHQRASASLAAAGLRVAAWVPLAARSKVLGVMTVAWRTARTDEECRLDLLQGVGAHFAAAIEAQGLLQDLRRRVGELTLLNDLAVASATLDPVLLLDNALRRMCETFEADVAAAYLREGDRLVLQSSLGALDRDGEGRVGEGISGLAVERRAPVVSHEEPGTGPRTRAERESQGIRADVAIPLLAQSEAVGALVLARRSLRPFTRSDVALLSAVGGQLGVAVENARLFAGVRRRLSDLEAVHEVALQIFGSAPGDVRALLDAGCRGVARALSVRATAILLVEDDGRTLRGAAAHGAPLPPERFAMPLEKDGLAVEALRSRAPVFSEDVTRDERSAMRGNPAVPPLSMLAVPLVSRRSVRGVLYLADDAGRRFTEAERALAMALGGELAMGIENAELYAEAQRRVEELSLMNEVGRSIAGSLDLGRVLHDGAEAARRLLGAGRGVVLLYEAARTEFRFGALSGEPVPEGSHTPVLPADGGDVASTAIRERRVAQVEDVDLAHGPLGEGTRRHGARAAVAAPLLLRGEPLGVLIVDESRRARRFSDAEVQRVTHIANQLAVAIENARLYQAARDRLSELATVVDVARVISGSLDLDRVLEAGAEHLKRTLRGSSCTILLVDPGAQVLRRAASRGGAIGAEALPLDAPSLARDALEAAAARAARTPASAGGADASLLALPLHARGEPVGVALVADDDAERAFSEAEVWRATAIASQLAVAVDNARLYSEARRRAEELGLLHEVGRSLIATLELKQVLDVGVRNLARIVDAPEAYLALADPDGAHLEIRAVAGGPPDALGSRVPAEGAGAALAALVYRTREPVVVADASADPRVAAPAGGARAYLGLPLLVRERNIGSAVIVETRGPRPFTPAEVERAAAVANQLAVAVENARLYEDLSRSYAELAHAQQQLVARERLAALGELSAVVAHEVRNPLGVIFNSLGSLRRLTRPAGDAKMLLDIIGEEADRLNRIVGDLLDFARPSTPVLRPEALDRLLDEALAAALVQHPRGISVVREVEAALPPAVVDARLVRQALLNLAVNAVQAMPRGGRITVRAARDGDHLLLELEDTGGGIPEEVRHRIFEPFFTTKASGTGLGLAVVKRIVEGHRGSVAVRSRSGEGTVFSLRFPLDPARVESRPAMG